MRSRFQRIERTVTAMIFFVGVDLALLLVLRFGLFRSNDSFVPIDHITGLVAAIVATWLSIRIMERGKWDLGLHRPLNMTAKHLAAGALIGFAIVVVSHLVIASSRSLDVVYQGTLDLAELFVLFLPAAFHEELLFRGYAFQKLAALHRSTALVAGAIVFSALHTGNRAVDLIALMNIALAGIAFGLLFLATRSLWVTFATHAVWNIMSGPVLGYEVSGYAAPETLFRQIDRGPSHWTGGAFGIEASVVVTVCVAIAIVVLGRIVSGSTQTYLKFQKRPSSGSGPGPVKTSV